MPPNPPNPSRPISRIRASVASVGVLALVALLWPQVAFALATDALGKCDSRSVQVAAAPVPAESHAVHVDVSWGEPPVLAWPYESGLSRPLAVAPTAFVRTLWSTALPPPQA